jgi:hypothetical protein
MIVIASAAKQSRPIEGTPHEIASAADAASQ